MIQVKVVINYLEANNLYRLSMIQKLPYRNLKWDDKRTEEDIINYDTGRTGYILEVDLEYPKELHDFHNDYPLAPDAMNVKADEKRFMKCVNNPSFQHSHIINTNLVGVEKQNSK